MALRYVIDHPRYGVRAEHDSLEDAAGNANACFPGGPVTEFRVVNQTDIADDTDQIVGHVQEAPEAKTAPPVGDPPARAEIAQALAAAAGLSLCANSCCHAALMRTLGVLDQHPRYSVAEALDTTRQMLAHLLRAAEILRECDELQDRT